METPAVGCIVGIQCCGAEFLYVSEVSVIFLVNYTQPSTVCFLYKLSLQGHELLKTQWLVISLS